MPHLDLEIDPLDKPIAGAEAIAAVLGMQKQTVKHLLLKGRLDADKVGHIWFSTPRRLLRQFAGNAA
jgi:hypothetical protein